MIVLALNQGKVIFYSHVNMPFNSFSYVIYFALAKTPATTWKEKHRELDYSVL